VPSAIEVRSLSRVFSGRKEIVALDDVDLTVEEGELFGLLGPNGAGKTTLIKILCTLLLPSSGTARVLGYDVDSEAKQIRKRINMVSGGEISGYGLLTIRENLWMFTQFYGVQGKVAKQRIDALLEEFGLEDKADVKLRTVSTGQRQKMNIIRGFSTDPDLIFLDEPTLGLDVTTSISIRNYLRRWVREREGRTMMLTTHYMREAEELCDRVAIIDRGRIVAVDTPAGLKRRVGNDSSFLIETTPIDTARLSSLTGVRGLTARPSNGHLKVRMVLEDESVIADVISAVVAAGGKVVGLSKNEPTLEDAFMHLVGRGLE
jgi:ABC-2 type transport system ATP-binding protein